MSTEPAPVAKKPGFLGIPRGQWAIVALFACGGCAFLTRMVSTDLSKKDQTASAPRPTATLRHFETTTPVVDCLPVNDSVRDNILSEVLSGTSKVGVIAAIKINPLADQSDTTTQWFEYAVRMADGPLDGSELLYVSTIDPGAADTSGLVWAANTLAEKLGPWPQPDKVKNWSVRGTNDEGKHALACLK